ncbi:MAG: T9SS type A sorting domain-containing protein [candidate division WOR-3 bacterium]|nr:T9SS type A sorting domain-containing protein [candidate division WOR-3 bacterium]
MWLIKTDALGETLWTRTFGDTSFDEGCCVRQAADRGFVIAGYTGSFGAGESDFLLVKTDADGHVAVTEPKASPTRAPALSLTCEPNPFRTRTAISLQLTADSPAELAIFDASGRCVRTLTVNRAPCTVWDGKDELGQPLPSGAYFARLDAAGQHASTRIVLQR